MSLIVSGGKILGSGGGVVSNVGAQTFVLQSLISGANLTAALGAASFFDDHGGNSATWNTDGTGQYATMNWAAGGTAGFTWNVGNTAKTGLYVKYDLRRNQNANSKELKLFGLGYPVTYSDETMGCNAGGYAGTNMGLSYSDATGGGDINTQFFLNQAPTLTGGSSYSRLPHPTISIGTGGTELINSTWQTLEWWVQQNQDGSANGEVAAWLNGTLIFWAVNMWNCGTGLQGFTRIDLGGYTDVANAGLTEDYKNWYVSYDRPTGRGI